MELDDPRINKHRGGGAVLDIEGKKFNKITVIEFIGYIKNLSVWYCRCDCGKEFAQIGAKITYGGTKSCGCLTSAGSKRDKKNGRFVRNGNKYSRTLYDYKKNALSRGLEWKLTDTQAIELIELPCRYCGIVKANIYRDIKYNGIDRIDNKVGYILNNVVSCCGDCNYSKGKKSYNDFIDHVLRIAHHQGRLTNGR